MENPIKGPKIITPLGQNWEKEALLIRHILLNQHQTEGLNIFGISTHACWNPRLQSRAQASKRLRRVGIPGHDYPQKLIQG